MKKDTKILLVVDNEKWAFYNIATNFQRELKGQLDIDIIAIDRLNGNVADLFLLAQKYDLIHLFWRGILLDFDIDFTQSYIYNMGLSKEEFIDKFVRTKVITTAVYDHKLLDEENINAYTKYTKAYYTSSTLLKKLYEELPLDQYPSAVITDGVDLNLFKPKKDRFKDIKKRPVTIGWVGNSKWDGANDHKGLNTIIKPAVEELIKDGYNIKLHLADSNVQLRSREEMAVYYDEIDLYVCCSINEGTPNPILESFACGIPVITTDVGIVRDLFGPKQKKYIMKERSVEELKKKIMEFLNNLEEVEELSKENLKKIEKWSWKYKAADFKKFVEKALK